MTWNEYIETLPEGKERDALKAQIDLPYSVFKEKVKCCYNCTHWLKDPTLMGDYAYNTCTADKKVRMYKWDLYCDKYYGYGKDENLLMKHINGVWMPLPEPPKEEEQ